MAMLNVRISDDLNNALIKSAKHLDRAKGYLVRKALEEYLLELQEDIEDYNDAEERLAKNEPTTPIDEVMKNLGFDDWDKKND